MPIVRGQCSTTETGSAVAISYLFLRLRRGPALFSGDSVLPDCNGDVIDGAADLKIEFRTEAIGFGQY